MWMDRSCLKSIINNIKLKILCVPYPEEINGVTYLKT